jgi:hypothetical protein
VDVTHRDQGGVEHHLEGLLHERNTDSLQINIRGRIKSIPRDQGDRGTPHHPWPIIERIAHSFSYPQPDGSRPASRSHQSDR